MPAEFGAAAFVYGGRLSLLRADWRCDSYSFGADPAYNIKDERFLVPEVCTGVEAHYGRTFARLVVEMQDWRGSAEGYNGRRPHTYGFTGFGFDLGFVY